MKRIILRTIAGIFIFGFVVLTGLYFYGFYLPGINSYFAKREEAAIMSKMALEKRVFLELHQKDTEGGTTPEETFDLFISALKAGNIDLASKYYVPIYQEEAKKVLENQLQEKGDLKMAVDSLVEIRTKGKKGCSDLKGELGGCWFSYTYIRNETSTSTSVISKQTVTFVSPKGSPVTNSIGFWLNPYTKKWKIKDQP